VGAPTPGGASHATPPGVVSFRDDTGGAATHESHGEGNAISIPGKSQEPRVNERIRIPQVRVIGDDGSQIGILATREAIAMAQSKGLDLVEVAPTARPPVCKIMDYGKFKYESNRAAKAAKKKQHQMQLKEVKMRPKIEDHDYDFKVKHARTFLEQRDKVKFTVTFRGREMAHQELGYKIIEQVLQDLSDVAVVEQPPRAEGRTVSLVLSPKAQASPRPHKAGADKADGVAPAS
jgi:translation initiation factor IF-3